MSLAIPCPVCRKPAVEASKPFCSTRCADIDLGRWMTESYAVPADPEDEALTNDEEQEIG